MNISQILTKLKSLVYSKSEADTLLSSKASSSHKHTKSEITDFPTIPTKTSQLTNDSGFITGVSWNNVSGKPSTFTPSSHTHTKSQITDFPSLATVATSGSYTDLSNKPTIPSNTNQLTNGAGFITSSGSCNYANSAGSAQPVFNNGTWYAVGDDAAIGDHNVGGGLGVKALNSTTTRIDLCYKDNAANYKSITYDGTTLYMNGNCDYAASAGSVAWGNVSGRPTVNNATLTIQKNGSNVATFTANASSNATANITVPTKTSQLTNDSGYITSAVTSLTLKVTDTNSSTQRTNPVIQGNSSNADYGINSCFGTCSNTIVGAGEGKDQLLSALAGNGDETLYLISDGNIYFHPNAQTYANRKTIILNTSGALTGLSGVSTSNLTVTNNSSNGVLFGSYRVYVG